MTHDTVPISAEQIDRLRICRGWSRERLLTRSGLDAATLETAQAAGHAPMPVAWKLASALGVPLTVLDRDSAEARRWLTLRALWLSVLIAAVVLLMASFGYRVGADLAARDNRADCVAAGGVDCDARR